MGKSFKNHRIKPNKKHRPGFSLGIVVKWGLVLAIWCTLILGGIIIYFAHDLPSIESALSENRTPVVVILAANGKKITKIGDVRATVKYLDLPVYLRQAITATEDRRFFRHFGIDIVGIFRAIIANISAGRIVQRGSTIPPQAA